MSTKRPYSPPSIRTEVSFETTALACAKTPDPPPGSFHFGAAYDTFTGHFGTTWGTWDESISGSFGVGFGPSGSTVSYGYSGLCLNWVTFAS
jgi:hypothetical protein